MVHGLLERSRPEKQKLINLGCCCQKVPRLAKYFFCVMELSAFAPLPSAPPPSSSPSSQSKLALRCQHCRRRLVHLPSAFCLNGGDASDSTLDGLGVDNVESDLCIEVVEIDINF